MREREEDVKEMLGIRRAVVLWFRACALEF